MPPLNLYVHACSEGMKFLFADVFLYLLGVSICTLLVREYSIDLVVVCLSFACGSDGIVVLSCKNRYPKILDSCINEKSRAG